MQPRETPRQDDFPTVTPTILSTFASAVDVLERQLGIRLPFSQEQQAGAVPKTVLVLGGNSELGRFIIQLLRLANPEVYIAATCYSDDPETDVFKTWPTPWTGYVIDGDYESRFDPGELCSVEPDLVEHLKCIAQKEGGFQVIIDVAGKVLDRPEFRDLLVYPKMCVRREEIQDHVLDGATAAELKPVLQNLLERAKIVPISNGS